MKGVGQGKDVGKGNWSWKLKTFQIAHYVPVKILLILDDPQLENKFMNNKLLVII